MADEFEEAGGALIQGMENGMRAIVDVIMAESLVQVPKDTGVLARSAYIDEPHDSTLGFNITFGYGYGDEINPKTHRLASDYAVPVHEILEGVGGRSGTGATHAPPTKAKFLEDPILEFAPMVQKELAIAMKKESLDEWWRFKGPTGASMHRGLLPGETADPRAGRIGRPMVRGAGGRFVREFIE